MVPARTGPVDDLGVEVHRATGPRPSRRDIESTLLAEGLTSNTWRNGADFAYPRHVHGYRKVLVCVSGSIVFHTDVGDVALAPGDRVELPSGVEHGATVGHEGVECVEAYRYQQGFLSFGDVRRRGAGGYRRDPMDHRSDPVVPAG